MDLDEARIEAYLLDIKRKKANNPLVSASLQARKQQERNMQNDLDNSSPNGKDEKKQLTQTSPRPPLNKSYNSNQGGESTHINASMQRVRNIYATNKERTEYLPVPSLNSIGLLPDGVITIKDVGLYGGVATESMLLRQPQVTSKKPPLCNRKPQMTRLSAGLRETKSSSLRLIRDPEEVLRNKRKLIAGASQSQIEINSKLTTPTTNPCKIERDKCSSKTQRAALASYTARSLGPDELIDIEDIPFDTLEEMENFMPELDRGSMKYTERRSTSESPEEQEKAHRKDFTAKHRIEEEECTGSGEIVNIPIKDFRESPSPVKREAQILSNDKLTDTTPDIISHCFDKTGGDSPSRPNTNNNLDKKEKKKKKKKSKLSFKWMHQTKAEKVVPFPVKDDEPHRKQRSKSDLERIAAMFCVETPQQAGLRRFLAGHEYVDDDEAFIKPGVWDCDIGSQLDDHPRKPARRVYDRTDVDKVENGMRNVNLKNNGRCLENGAITGMHKMSKRLKKLAKNAQ